MKFFTSFLFAWLPIRSLLSAFSMLSLMLVAVICVIVSDSSYLAQIQNRKSIESISNVFTKSHCSNGVKADCLFVLSVFSKNNEVFNSYKKVVKAGESITTDSSVTKRNTEKLNDTERLHLALIGNRNNKTCVEFRSNTNSFASLINVMPDVERVFTTGKPFVYLCSNGDVMTTLFYKDEGGMECVDCLMNLSNLFVKIDSLTYYGRDISIVTRFVKAVIRICQSTFKTGIKYAMKSTSDGVKEAGKIGKKVISSINYESDERADEN